VEELKIIDTKIYVSYSFLRRNGVSDKSISNWSYRRACNKTSVNETTYIEYSSIPKPTLSKLPSESEIKSLIHDQKNEKEENQYYHILKTAYEKEFIKFKDEYKKDERLTPDQIIQCARRRAVWEKILEFKKGSRGKNPLLHKVFNAIFFEDEITPRTFNQNKTKARKEINSVVYDRRWFREQHSTLDPQIKYWTSASLSNPVNNTIKSIWRDISEKCKAANIEPPSYGTIKNYVNGAEKNHEIYSSKYGKEKAFNNVEPYAKIISAKHAGSQWQLDGWDLPFYYKGDYKGKLTSHLKLILIAVRDSHSRKIIGYSIGESENTQTILKAIEDAVKNTGYLPFEIVSDNHSFNKTKEAEYFKEAIDSIGVTWTVSHNPRRKALAERYFRHLGEVHCKKYDGYIGQGIKTREKTGKPAQEYIDHFTAGNNWLTKEEIISIAIMVVNEFNETPLTAIANKTPNEAHEQSEKPNTFRVDILDRLRLFTKKTELKVIRGQINLTRSGTTYEYQLNAEQFSKLNGEQVIIRYEDFSLIYLFDAKDRPMGTVKQKVGIHGAVADQTEEDIEKLYWNKGRLNGIKAKAKKANEQIRDKALSIHPNAYEAINPIKNRKSVLKEIEQSYESKQRAEDLGVDFDLVEVTNAPKNFIPKSLQPMIVENKSPFTTRGNHKPSVIDQTKGDDEFLDND
jgi:hypothetical protein